MDYDTWQTLKVSPSVRGLFGFTWGNNIGTSQNVNVSRVSEADYDSEANLV